jgi:hypothetical protein
VSVGRSSPLDHVFAHHIRVMGVCDLSEVGDSSIFGLVRGTGTFTGVLPTFVLVSRIQVEEQYCGNDHFLSAVSSS